MRMFSALAVAASLACLSAASAFAATDGAGNGKPAVAMPSASAKQAFIDMARKVSADEPTRDQGGRLGWIEKGQSWPELEAAAFATGDNALAGPVKTDAGWHLLYVEGHQTGKQRSFDEVKANVRNVLYQQKVQKRLKEWVEDLKAKYYVERRSEG